MFIDSTCPNARSGNPGVFCRTLGARDCGLLLLVIAATLAYRRQHVVLGGDGAVVGLTVLVAKRVAAEKVIQISGFGAALLPGAKGFHNSHAYRLNASYLPLQP